MTDLKPTFRWHELIRSLSPPPPDPVTFKRILAWGQEAHSDIQKILTETYGASGTPHLLDVEKSGVYEEEEMPFKIRWHIDLYDRRTDTMYEIKPLVWWMQHLDYCIAQASGYWQFCGAKNAYFIIYQNADKKSDGSRGKRLLSLLPVPRKPWVELREIAQKEYKESEIVKYKGLNNVKDKAGIDA